MNLLAALEKLDIRDEGHWTADGLPRLNVVAKIMRVEKVTRMEVNKVAITFNRETAEEMLAEDEENLAEVEEELRDYENEDEGLPQGNAPISMPQEQAEELPTLPGLAPGDSVMSMDARTVIASPVLTEALVLELDDKINEAHQRRTAIDNELDQLNGKNQIAKRAQENHARRAPKGDQMNAVRAYHATQKKLRAEKTTQMHAFMASGISGAQIAAVLNPRAKIDTVMNNRNKGRGNRRPQIPLSR